MAGNDDDDAVNALLVAGRDGAIVAAAAGALVAVLKNLRIT